jgi:HEAT repeat protein
MFDFLKRGGGPTPKQIDKAVKRLTETHGEEGPRIEAAERLFDWGTPDALFALLKRFTMSSRVISQDVEEKRMVVEMLVEKGDDAIGPIQRFMKTHSQVDWPVRALARIVSKDDLVAHLVAILEEVAASEFAAPAHRVSLIRAVHDHVSEAMAPLLESFLEDPDDDVRLASVEALIQIGESTRERLLEAFIAADDQPRIRRTIADLFVERGWAVTGYRPRIEECLPDGFGLNSKGVLQHR